MLVFLLLIAVQTFAIELFALSTALVVVVTVLPVLPLVWAFFIYRTRFKQLDEYLQRLTGEAFLWTTAIMCFVTFIYGMLAMKLPLPNISLAYILPIVISSQGLILQLLLWEDSREK